MRSTLRRTYSDREGNRIEYGANLALAIVMVAKTLLDFGKQDMVFIISLGFYPNSFFSLKYIESVIIDLPPCIHL
ncbi:hypothetical protein NVIRENTERO_03633 [Sodalis praecaptivus]|nr:hypothetical protein NVIRENTERO_03633 [Sodalis praecaptivus]